MDRQAWIAITLCVIGLVLWQIYMMKHPTPVSARLAPSPSPSVSIAPLRPSSPVAAKLFLLLRPSATPPPAESRFRPSRRKKEILRNSDMELRLTNRGGAISEVVLLNHVAEGSQRVVLNSPDRAPIGAIVQRPEARRFRNSQSRMRPTAACNFSALRPSASIFERSSSSRRLRRRETILLRKWMSIFATTARKPITIPTTFSLLVPRGRFIRTICRPTRI